MKFEQNWTTRSTQNLELLDKKSFTMLTFFDIGLIVGAILKEVSMVKMKQLNDAKL